MTHVYMKKTFSLILILALIVTTQLSVQESPKSTHSISLNFSNFRNNDGYLYIYLYKTEKQYPYHPYKHFKVSKKRIKNNRLKYTIYALAKGKYAISAIDDENSNMDLDRFWGIPTEGYAFSNNPNTWGFPSYHRLKFGVYSTKNYQHLKMQYI